MNSDRWRQIDELFQACLEVDGERRAALLDNASRSDQALREAVEALLASDSGNWSFIEKPALETGASLLAEEDPQLESGHRLGHYEIVELIGRGGMGEVYLARDQILNRPIALKFLPPDYTQDKDRLRRFQREAQAASALNHPNILTIHQLGDVDGQQFIATELVEGETLRRRLSRGLLTPAEAAEVAIQVTSALAAAHKAGIVHRDIKPENIMLRPDGYVKVLDFGLAKLAEQSEALSRGTGAERIDVSSGLLMGTVRYMSPEQARGEPVDARSDIFSLGVVLYELITGRPPFDDKSPARLVESILRDEPAALACPGPGELEAIIGKCLRKDRTSRYQNAGELLIDLKNLKELFQDEVRRSEGAGATKTRYKPTPLTSDASTNDGLRTNTTTLESLVSTVKRPRVAIALIILLSSASVIGYASYKLLRRTGVDPAAAKSLSQAGRWNTKAAISSPRARAEPAVLNGVLYVAGGWNVCTPFANLESYDPTSDTWTQRAPMLTARGSHGVGVVNGLLYAVGGEVDCGVDIASVEAYNPATDTWSVKASLPTKRVGHVVAVANGKLYAIGGDSNGTGYLGLNTEYDPQSDNWIARAPMPTPRHASAVAVVNDIIYVIGGGPGTLATVEAYDPRTDSWTSKRPMLTGRVDLAAAVLNGVIYVLGGNGNRIPVEAYDPATDTWTVVAQLPARRSEFHAAGLDGSIYFAGGFDEVNYLSSVLAFTPDSISQPSPAPCPSSYTIARASMPTARSRTAAGEISGIIYVVGGFDDTNFLAINEAYDPVANKWMEKSPMPTARDLMGTNNAVVDGRLYVIGGNAKGYCTSANEAYDPATDTWTTRAPMPTARCNLAVVAVDGLIYALGGTNTQGSIRYTTMEVYNPTTDTWTTVAPLPTSRQDFAAVSFNGILYAVGGFNAALTQGGALNVVEAYDTISKTWTTKASLPTPRRSMAAGVVNGSLIVVGGQNDSKSIATVEAYDSSKDRWMTVGTMPIARTFSSAVTLNNTFYAFGGSFPGFPGALTINEAITLWPCSAQN